jgi:FkbM family methyltransferase
MKNLLVKLLSEWQRVKRKLSILSFEKEYSNLLSGKIQKYGWKIQDSKTLSMEGMTLSHYKNNSFLMNVKLGDAIETKLVSHKIWDEELLELMHHFIQKNPNGVVLDIGANIGAITIPLAASFPECRFYCFEPHPVIYKRLKTNIDLNQFVHVNAVQAAVSDQSGKLDFYAQTDNLNMGLSSLVNVQNNPATKISVDCITLDDFFRAKEMPSISAVKIDVQGSEILVLKGMSALIRKHRPVLFFEHEDALHPHDAKEVKQQIVSFMEDHNYEMYHANSALISFRYFPQVNLSGTFNGNILAIPRKQG